ncbi:YheC/YheD family protein [Paenibacillus ginsengarvi]|uniref:YheC/YheD family protein n=1 Tax=Paenibacillus ginsengarvi TaxID=400777 RepID=A0A3B0C788_9BACL|nr:YheC/YheD family protein [Paenibacillus ginsengarvi]RKN80444.1 YheC/YheD family protein [Paenibacillus ginsengarvi]
MEQDLQEEGKEANIASAEQAAELSEIPQPAAADASAPPASEQEEKATISRQVASKWVKTSVLQQDGRVARYIPETHLFSPAHLGSMLSRYGRVVMKPVVGTGGSGVVMIIKSGSSYTVRHRRKIRRFGSFSAMQAFVNGIRRRRSYLVQRGISLATIGGRPIDYRVKMVKEHGGWVTRAMVGRLANPGMFVTNLCRGGTMLSSTQGISRSLSSKLVRRKKAEMRDVTRTCIQLLERHFPGVGQLGFDYGFDRSGRMWIFEVNTRPH